MSVAPTPIAIEMRPPSASFVSMSLPSLSVPSGCSSDGVS